MVHIQDAVVGDIEPTETEVALIEDPHMQRLRYVKQLGMANLVYPGANHTRFEHSLGTMHITKEICEGVLGERNEELECVGLLHDIGHGPFSHYSDGLLDKYLKTTHEKIGEEIIRNTSIKDVIQDSTLSPGRILSYFNGNDIGALIAGAVGSDRFDYLMRDSHYTGVAYGVIDYADIKKKIVMHGGRPAMLEKGIGSAEYMLIARYSMFQSIYHHHGALIAQSMYQKAVEDAIALGDISPDELKTLNDNEMMARLSSSKDSKPLAERLLNRKLFKRVFWDYVSASVNADDVRKSIENSGVPYNSYTVKVVKFKGSGNDISVVGKNDELIGKLNEVSPLVATLESVLSGKPRLLVSCEKEYLEKAKGAIEAAIPA